MRLTSTALLILLSLGCGKTHFVLAPPTGTDTTFAVESRPEHSVSGNVVLVSIDGLRPDAIAAFNAPTLTRLVSEGSYTLSATTILPSKTLPSHTSMLTGELPDRHGVLWNTAYKDRPGTLGIPTIFGAARSRGYRTAAFFSKSKFSHLQVPGTLDYSQSPGGWFGRWSSSSTLDDVEKYLSGAAPNLLFVHLTDPDAAGHSYGWMSREYGRGVLRADAALERLLRAADNAYGEGEYTLIVTADHGGNGRDHGSDHVFDVTIPWIAWGRGVMPGEIVSTKVRTVDTASTVLFLLGLDEPRGWAGVPIRNAFSVAVND
jgi:predicted AlkP superfamily pyrophosphatase or phosphodiesterase